MEDDPPLPVVMALRASSGQQTSNNHADPPPSSSSSAPPTTGADRRLRFYVELKPGETTIVSWKKLLKGAATAAGSTTPPAGAHPTLHTRIAPPTATPAAPAAEHHHPMDCDANDPQPGPGAPNRFNAVIEKIERLYMGKDSSDDEQLAGVPDDDQYDTEDSFIDDTELDDYFQVDKSDTKHQGFFINKGKLERIEPSQPSALTPKKRMRKELVKLPGEKDAHRMPNEFVSSVGSVRMKDAARKAALIGKRPYDSSTAPAEDKGCNHEDGKNMKDKLSAVVDISKTKMESSSPMTEIQPTRLSRKDLPQSSDKMDLHKSRLETHNSVEPGSNSSKIARETSDVLSRQANDTTTSLKEDYGSHSIRKAPANERNGTVVLPDLNYPGTTYPTQTTRSDVQMKMATTVRPKGSALDRAIIDLEKSVATCKPSKVVIREGDATQVVRKRLPGEVKQKLAKVARLANSRGKITSQQFLDRLMGILGHLVQPTTLKRHLKEMVEVGLTIKQAKTDKFQQIKKEVSEMIKVRLNASKVLGQPTGSSDDFQDPLNNGRRAACIDEAVEDKIYALYDLYVEGMDEDIGPQSRKLYAELADLWPAGYMDTVGIKDVIHRARRRRREAYKLSKVKYEEGIKRPRLSPANKLDTTLKSSSQVRNGTDRLASGPSG